jgi:Flp pilus assembly protein TadG
MEMGCFAVASLRDRRPRRRVRPQRLCRERGQALAEMAMLLPVILLLFVGLIECVNLYNHFISVTNAARDGARIGAKGDSITDDEIRSLVENDLDRLPNGIDPDDDVTIDRAPQPGEDAIEVTACYDHELLLHITLIMPDTYRVCSSTTMKLLPTPEAGP